MCTLPEHRQDGFASQCKGPAPVTAEFAGIAAFFQRDLAADPDELVVCVLDGAQVLASNLGSRS